MPILNMHHNLAKFGRVVAEICMRTDRQTDKLSYSDRHPLTVIRATIGTVIKSDKMKTL